MGLPAHYKTTVVAPATTEVSSKGPKAPDIALSSWNFIVLPHNK